MKRIKFQTLAKLGTCMLLILLLVKVFIGEWVYIPSDSMFPTISARSLVWNSKITYGALMPQRIVETPVLNLLCLIPAVAKAEKKQIGGIIVCGDTLLRSVWTLLYSSGMKMKRSYTLNEL